MSYVVASIRENPELAIFLTLAIGFAIGRIRIGSFSLGNVVGTLLAGVLVGQLGVEVRSPREGRLLRPLPLRHRLQGRAPVLPRPRAGTPLSQALLTVVLCVTSLADDGRWLRR